MSAADHAVGRLAGRLLDPQIADALAGFPADLDHTRGVQAFVPDTRPLLPADDPLVDVRDIVVAAVDGHPVPIRTYAPRGDRAVRGPASARRVLFLHGGGFISDGPGSGDHILRRWADALDMQFAAPTLRLAPRDPYPAALDDAAAALGHLDRQTGGPLVVFGVSAGATIAMGLALRARDGGGPDLTAVVLATPATDDRMTTRSVNAITDTRVWNRGMMELAWRAYLGRLHGTDDVPATAAPARATDLSGLPHTTITVNDQDPLRDEALDFARRLWRAGTPTDVHFMPGTFHGSMSAVPEAEVSRRELWAIQRGLMRGRSSAG